MKKWKLLSSTVALDERWFKVRRDTVRLPNDKIIDDYFVWVAPEVVMVVPITHNGKFVLIKQYKHGIRKIIIEFPAGVVENGDSAQKTARRELEEETGYVAKKIKLLGKLYSDPTKKTSKVNIYSAENVLPMGKQKFDETEEIEVLVKSYAEVIRMMKNGDITDECSLSAMFLLEKKHLGKFKKK